MMMTERLWQRLVSQPGRRRRSPAVQAATTIETVEPRLLLAATIWDAPRELTFSIAPDGTEISGKVSSFRSSFASLGSPGQLQKILAEAFHTWTQHANVNVGLVGDGGQAFGVAGPTQHDGRFGDIRIGAVPMSSEVLALSVPRDRSVSGTWAGDIVLNSTFQPTSLEQFRAVVLHEVGHVLGLDHSTDPTSVMFAHNDPSVAQVPTAADIANLVDLYGERIGFEDADRANDTINRATRMRDGSFDGSFPLIRYGDISTATDVDFFRLDPIDGYNGPVTIHLIADDVSLLRGRVSVTNRRGTILATPLAPGYGGRDTSITIPSMNDTRLYLKVEGAAQRFNTGRYLLVAVFDGLTQVGIEAIGPEARRDLSFLEHDEVGELLTTQTLPEFEDDLHLNDTIQTATRLTTLAGREKFSAYEYQATVSDETDIDFYSIRSPQTAGNDVLTVTLRVANRQTLIPDLNVFDGNRQPIAATIVANGNGLYTVQVSGIQRGTTYFIRVAGEADSARYRTGNYHLSASFNGTPVEQFEFVSGQLNNNAPTQFLEMDLQRTTLVSYALEATVTAVADVATQVTIFNETGEELLRIVGINGTTRTGDSILLPIGRYYVRIGANTQNGSPIPTVRFRLLGRTISNDVGPLPTTPIETPPPLINESQFEDYLTYTPPLPAIPDPVAPEEIFQDPWIHIPISYDPFSDYEDWYWFL